MIPPPDPSTALLRRRRRKFIVVLIVLVVQAAWTGYGSMNGATSFGWGRRVSFRNVSATSPPGTYIGNEGGMWLIAQLGWRPNEANAPTTPIVHRGGYGMRYTDARSVGIRFAAMSVRWTLVPNAIVALVTGLRWSALRRRVRLSDPSHDRGFEIAPPPPRQVCPTCGQEVDGHHVMPTR